MTYYVVSTCHRQDMCEQTVLRFSISLRRTFPKEIHSKVMKKYKESAVVQFFWLFNMLTVEGCSENGAF